jgi:hypothetical protein
MSFVERSAVPDPWPFWGRSGALLPLLAMLNDSQHCRPERQAASELRAIRSTRTSRRGGAASWS